MMDEVGKPLEESRVSVRRLKPEEDYDGLLQGIWESVRPALNHDAPTHPSILMSLVCNCSGRAAEALSLDDYSLAEQIIKEQVGFSLRALRELSRPK